MKCIDARLRQLWSIAVFNRSAPSEDYGLLDEVKVMERTWTERKGSAWKDIWAHEKRRTQEADSFKQALNAYGNTVFPVAVAISLIWLLFIPFDLKLQHNVTTIVAIRIGFTLCSLTLLALNRFTPLRNWSVLLLAVLALYVEVATPIIAALSLWNPDYLESVYIVIVLLALLPFPRKISWGLILLSVLALVVSGGLLGTGILSPHLKTHMGNLGLAVALSATFIYLLDRVRFDSWNQTHKIEKQSLELKTDKDKIDGLLLNLLPPPVTEELHSRGRITPIFFESATVLTTDFVNFTKNANRMTPISLVKALDIKFSQFDEIMDKYDLVKLNTIGDSYICAGGIPATHTTHALDCVLAALDIVNFIKKEKVRNQKNGMGNWDVRVGINTGPIMAGIVGENQFVYDIWGDAVHKASRIENLDEPNRINISESTYELIKDYFDCEECIRIPIRGRGFINMYYVNRIKSQFSRDDAGNYPNERLLAIRDNTERQTRNAVRGYPDHGHQFVGAALITSLH